MKNVNDMTFNTKAIHAGSEHDPLTGAHVAPIYRTSTFVMKDMDTAIKAGYGDVEGIYAYTRYSNPTTDAVERKIAALEGADDCAVTASGMCAITTALLSVLRAGDHIIVGDTVYGGTFEFINNMLPGYGIEKTVVDTTAGNVENIRKAMRPNTKAVYIETPCNPTLGITDIKKAAEYAHEGNALLFVDSTFATPYLQKPLALGADIVIHSCTKYMNGHGDLLGGAICGNKKLLSEIKGHTLKFLGGIMSPFEAASLSKGMKTLGIRMEKHCENAMKIAEFLDKHYMVEKVLYPGLETHLGHDIAAKQMKKFGAMMSFNVRGGFEAGKLLMEHVNLISLATSLGNVDSLIQHSASMSHATLTPEERAAVGIAEGQVRLSVGIEDADELMEDLDEALNYVKKTLKL